MFFFSFVHVKIVKGRSIGLWFKKLEFNSKKVFSAKLAVDLLHHLNIVKWTFVCAEFVFNYSQILNAQYLFGSIKCTWCLLPCDGPADPIKLLIPLIVLETSLNNWGRSTSRWPWLICKQNNYIRHTQHRCRERQKTRRRKLESSVKYTQSTGSTWRGKKREWGRKQVSGWPLPVCKKRDGYLTGRVARARTATQFGPNRVKKWTDNRLNAGIRGINKTEGNTTGARTSANWVNGERETTARGQRKRSDAIDAFTQANRRRRIKCSVENNRNRKVKGSKEKEDCSKDGQRSARCHQYGKRVG